MSSCRLPARACADNAQRRKGIAVLTFGTPAPENVFTTGRRAQRSDVVDASRSLQSIGVLPTRGWCRRRSWSPRQTGLRAGEGRHNPRCRTRGVQNRTEASRVDVRSNAWLAQRRTLLRGQRFHFNRGAEDRVAAKQSCARGIAPRRTSAARQVAQDCADRASRNLRCQTDAASRSARSAIGMRCPARGFLGRQPGIANEHSITRTSEHGHKTHAIQQSVA